MSKNSDFEKLTKNIDWNRLLFTVIPLLKPFIIFGSWVIFARLNTKASVTSKLIAIAEAIPTIDLGVPKEIVLASLYDFADDTVDLLDSVVETILDPVGIQKTKEGLRRIKELALEGETTVEIETGSGTFGQKVTSEQLIDQALKWLNLDDDIIR